MSLDELKEKLKKTQTEVKNKREDVSEKLKTNSVRLENAESSEELKEIQEILKDVRELESEIEALKNEESALLDEIQKVADGDDGEDSGDGDSDDGDSDVSTDSVENSGGSDADSVDEGKGEEVQKIENKRGNEKMAKVMKNGFGDNKGKDEEVINYNSFENINIPLETMLKNNDYNPQNVELEGDLRVSNEEEHGLIVEEEDKTFKKEEKVQYFHKHVTMVRTGADSGKINIEGGDVGEVVPIVDENEETPELGFYNQYDREYKLNQHAGYRGMSKLLARNTKSAAQKIKNYLKNSKDKTKEDRLFTVLADKLETVVVNEFDELKTIKNVDLGNKYGQVSIYASGVAYDILDRAKNAVTGAYLLKEDITSPSGKSLFGLPIYVFDNSSLDDGTLYIGNVDNTVRELDRGVSEILLAENTKKRNIEYHINFAFDYIVFNEEALIHVDINGINDLGVEVEEEEPTP